MPSRYVTKTLAENAVFDTSGYLANTADWSRELARTVAAREGITLSERHWTVIEFARSDFEATGRSPTLSRLNKLSSANVRELYALFPDPNGPAKQIARIAGLKKPVE